MKRSVSFLLLTVLVAFSLSSQQVPNVLYVGNSYTYVNDLPLLVEEVASSAGYIYKYDSNTPGGCTFAQHCSNESMSKICKGGWDFVVLQEQSQLPSFPQNQVDVECLPYARQLADSVKAHGGMPMFYMTWGRKNGDPQNALYFPVLGTYEGMDSMLYERYMQMAIENNAAVCPVGRVWRYLRANNPEIELYSNDGSHPSIEGSYAAACSFFVMLFDADPDSIKYTAGLKDSVALNIRAAVKTVVFDKYDKWIDPANYEEPEEPTSVLPVVDVDEYIWPNPVTDIIHAKGAFKIIDLNGRVVLRGENQADVSSLASGCYLLVLTAQGDVNKAIRFVKK
ncbi:MAG: T9SS type A sorting domain-containing protein [Paludibacteraceae bacterium]|nr:T9SS type A sorting domain-containing protein [Paludibacteraceae bacterium]